MTARMRLPTFLPISADSRPGSIVPPITVGLLVKVLALSEEFLPCQKYRTKLAARASVLVRVVPLPWMSVLTVRLLPGVAFGMVTFGVLSNAPVAVTAVFAPGEAAAEDEEDAEDDEEAVDFDDPPQPARTRQASKGMAMSARKRRMKNLNSGGCQLRQPTGRTEWARPAPGCVQRTHSLCRYARLHPRDELLDPLVHRAERVLAQDRPLGLVVQLEVHPVDGEVADRK